MRRLLLLLAILLGTIPAAAQTSPPKRVVTVNLCLDLMALRLAAPGQLVGVSYLSHDLRLSALADRARAIAPVRAKVEAILALRPDLVIMDEASHANIKRLLREAGVPILELHWASTLAESETLIARMAKALGDEAEGRKLVERMQADRQALAWTQPPVGTAAVLQANRGTNGQGSLMNELLGLSGFRNLAAELGLPAFGRMSLETVLAGQPDLLVLDAETNANPARGTEFVDHHLMKVLEERAKVAKVPMKYAVCAGPESVEVLRRLAEARAAVKPGTVPR
jgi:iron complex transport system substrate-binding protein